MESIDLTDIDASAYTRGLIAGLRLAEQICRAEINRVWNPDNIDAAARSARSSAGARRMTFVLQRDSDGRYLVDEEGGAYIWGTLAQAQRYATRKAAKRDRPSSVMVSDRIRVIELEPDA